MKLNKALLATVAIAGLTAAMPASAATAVTGFTGGTAFPSYTTGTTTTGWYFTVSSTVQVTSLGYYALSNAGAIGTLANSHQVGIWQGTTLLGSTTVTAGAGSPYRYASVVPITLLAGVQYTIGGSDSDTDGDSYVSSVSNLTTDPTVNFLGSARSAGADGFVAPTTLVAGVNGRFGPNFQFNVVAGAVPEPATWAMMLVGFGMMGASMRYRRRSTKAVLA